MNDFQYRLGVIKKEIAELLFTRLRRKLDKHRIQVIAQAVQKSLSSLQTHEEIDKALHYLADNFEEMIVVAQHDKERKEIARRNYYKAEVERLIKSGNLAQATALMKQLTGK